MSTTASNNVCKVCEGKEHDSVFKSETLEYLMCKLCGFVFLKDEVKDTVSEDFYDESYQGERHGITEYETAVRRLEEKGSYEKKKPRAKEFEPYLKEASKVLEIGSGYGTFLKVLKDKYGSDVEGIEPGQIGSKVAKEYYGLPVTTGTLDSVLERKRDAMKGTFDCVLMVHVLEHLSDPLSSLKEIKKILKKDGVLYIAVPNIAKPDEALDSFFHIEHLSYFSLRTLRNLLQEAGFKVVTYQEKALEMVMIATPQESKLDEVSTDSFDTLTPAYLKKTLRLHDRKYRVLRISKGIVSFLLPQQAVRGLTKSSASLLRRMGVIRI